MTPIRRARPTDAADLHELAAETFPLACPPGSSEASIAAFIAEVLSVQRFEEYLADPDRELLIAGDFDGYAMLVHGEPADADVAAALTTRPTVELSKIYVRPGRHGSGVAGALMAGAIEAARDRGALAVWLGVNQENARANAFYEKSGFRQVGLKHFMVGDERHDDFTRELVLPAA
ncbi:MAG: GNAT family N-acetyltransferase [Solirubrobacteraceae bacterium]|nr:GNAT family N-acetyltransferase [Solirubrobacteraceae bacterium]